MVTTLMPETLVEEVREEEEEEEDSVLHICDGCSFQTEELSEFLVHIEANLPHQQTCLSCQRKFNPLAALKKHLIVHQTERRSLVSCQTCRYKALTAEALQTHQFTCHLSTVFSCVSCGHFSSKTDKFAQHLRSHHSLVGVKTAQKIVKRQSQQVRKDPRPREGTKLVYVDTPSSSDSFKCRECQYKSNTRNNLQRHIRKHHTKTFQCSQCPYTGSCKSELLRHTRTSHATQKDGQRPNSDKIVEMVDSSQVYVCEVCFVVQTSFEEYEGHLRVHRRQ